MKFKSLLAYLNGKNEATKNVSVLSIGTLLSQMIVASSSLILTRMYTPDDFGVFSLFTAISSIIAVISTARYELAIMLPKSEEKAFIAYILTVLSGFAISIIWTVIICFSGSYLSLLLKTNTLKFFLYFSPLSVISYALYQSSGYWLNRSKEYKVIAINRILQSLLTVFLNISIWFIFKGPHGLIFGTVMGQLIILIYINVRIIISSKEYFKYLSYKNIKRIAIMYIDFPKYSTGDALLNTTSQYIPSFILSSFFGSSYAGFYSLANRVLILPLTIVSNSIGQVFFQEASILNRKKLPITVLASNTSKKLLKLGILPFSILTVFGLDVFVLVFGEHWSEAGKYAQVLSLWLFFVFITSPLSNVLPLLQKQKQGLMFNIILFSSRLSTLLLGGYILKNSFAAVCIFGISNLALWILYNSYLMKLTGNSTISNLKNILIYGGSCMLIMILLKYLLNL